MSLTIMIDCPMMVLSVGLKPKQSFFNTLSIFSLMNEYTKKQALTDSRFGKHPSERTVAELIEFGCISIDKPPGPTSHQVSDYVQKILGIESAGHGGSLDPQVTGVLPVTLDRATRLSQVMLKSGKEYIGVMHLHHDVDGQKLRAVIQKHFIGTITQMPPVRSAVKRALRERNVYRFDILEIEEKDVLFHVECQAGTYIRKLCSDLGQKLNVGAHMLSLRRVRAAHFREHDSVTLQDVQDAMTLLKQGNEKFIRHCIHPAEKMIEFLPKVWVFDSAVESICHGRDVAVPGISKFSDIKLNDDVAVMTLKDELVALGIAQMDDKSIMKSEKGIAVRVHKVFMKAGTYGGATG